jgi:hypothetical protein
VSLPQEFLDLMPLTIQIAHQSSINPYNEATYAPPVEYRARLEPTFRMLRSVDGTEQIVSARLIVDAQGELVETDQVTLPDGRKPSVAAVTTEYDEFGVHHQTIELYG